MKRNALETAPAPRSPAEFLRDIFQARKERNPYYSQSAFARDLGISISILHRVMAGQRAMSLKLGMQISAALGLSETESRALTYGIVQNASKTAKISRRMRERLEQDYRSSTPIDEVGALYTTVEMERFRAMAQWYHVAILNLVVLDHFDSDPSWIAKALGISLAEARDALDRLLALGLLEEKDGKLSRTKKHFFVKTQKNEVAVRKYHEGMITKAVRALARTDERSFHRRLVNGITFACGVEHVEAIKDRIDRFEDDILALVQTGTSSEVYQMNVQLFPLTQINDSAPENGDKNET